MVSEKTKKPEPVTVVLTGPTAVGKSTLSLKLAEKFPQVEIINADSLLFYRGVDIGSAKPSLKEQARVPHHLIDICNPDTHFSAGDFFRAAEEKIKDIHLRGKRALIVGGSGFYIQTLLLGMWEAPAPPLELRASLEALPEETLYALLAQKDKACAERIHIKDRYRTIRALELMATTGRSVTDLKMDHKRVKPRASFRLWILDLPQAELEKKIAQRTEKMIHLGLIEEVTQLKKQFPHSHCLRSVGYAQVCNFLSGKHPAGRTVKLGILGLREEIQLATRQLVKNQRTWFKKWSEVLPMPLIFPDQHAHLQLEEMINSVYE